jgi:hypothetical protein
MRAIGNDASTVQTWEHINAFSRHVNIGTNVTLLEAGATMPTLESIQRKRKRLEQPYFTGFIGSNNEYSTVAG